MECVTHPFGRKVFTIHLPSAHKNPTVNVKIIKINCLAVSAFPIVDSSQELRVLNLKQSDFCRRPLGLHSTNAMASGNFLWGTNRRRLNFIVWFQVSAILINVKTKKQNQPTNKKKRITLGLQFCTFIGDNDPILNYLLINYFILKRSYLFIYYFIYLLFMISNELNYCIY